MRKKLHLALSLVIAAVLLVAVQQIFVWSAHAGTSMEFTNTEADLTLQKMNAMDSGMFMAPARAGNDNPAALAQPQVFQASASKSIEASESQYQSALARLPLRFIPNSGQIDSNVHYTVKGAGHTIFFTPEEVVFSAVQEADSGLTSSQVRLGFVGANPQPSIEALSPMRAVVNFFLGNDPAKWQTDVPTYGGLAYRQLYPGIDLVYRGTQGILKSEFLVAPGADPAAIRMVYRGAQKTRLGKDGSLVIQTELGQLVEQAPIIYQEVDGIKKYIPGRYIPLGRSRFGFRVGDYDPTLPLVIDPVLVFSSYLGGSINEAAWGIEVDQDGNIYVAGWTNSSDFPTYNPYQTDRPDTDTFVTKIIRAGDVYTYGFSTYLGGSGVDYGRDIDLDAAGNIYIAGETGSFDFPLVNEVQGDQDYADAFVSKFITSSGSLALDFSSYLGGDGGSVFGRAVATNDSGDIFVCGWSESDSFITTTNAIQPHYIGGRMAFVSKIVGGSGVYNLDYSSYLGGSGNETCEGIAADNAGNAYVTGITQSSTNYPTTTNAIQPYFGGGGIGIYYDDVFVTSIISSTGVYTYGYSSFLGGDGEDEGHGIALDDNGDIYVTGHTQSTNFPTHKAIEPGFAVGQAQAAFATHIIDSGGVYTYAYSTYVNGGHRGNGTTVDSGGNTYLAGYSYSAETLYDVFAAQIITSSGAYTYGFLTTFGGNSYDYAWDIAVDSSGNIYLAGQSESTDFPTTKALQTSMIGPYDAIVAKIAFGLNIKKSVTPQGTLAPGDAITYTLSFANEGLMTADDVWITDTVPLTVTNLSVVSSGAQITATGGVDYAWEVETLSPGEGGTITITGVVNPAASGLSTLTNQATITSTEGSFMDTTLEDNTSSVQNTLDGEAPLPPTLSGPLNSAVMTDTTPTFSWGASPSPDVAGYSFSFNGDASDIGNTTTYTSGQLVDDTYTWSVAAYDQVGNTGAFTDTWSFTIDTTPPSAVTLISPEHNARISDTTPTLTWVGSNSPDLGGYLLDFNGVVTDVGDVTTYTTSLLADGFYTWTVATYDQVGNAGAFVSPWTFTVDSTGPDPISLLSPADDSATNDTTPTLTWNPSSSPDSAGYLLDFNGTIVDVGDLTAHTTGVLSEGIYTWTVAAYDTLSNIGSYAAPWTFSIDTTAPQPPGWGLPLDQFMTALNTVEFTWDASTSPDTAGYMLDLNGSLIDVGDTGHYTSDPLPDNTYSWCMRAYDGAGNMSTCVGYRTLTVDTTPPLPPALVSPSDGSVFMDTFEVQLTWNPSPSPDAAGYQLDFNGQVLDVGEVTTYLQAVGTGTYTWTVAAYDQLGNTSAYAEPWSLSTSNAILGLTAANDGPTELGQATRLTADITSGSSVTYNWELGDSNIGIGAVVTHTYAQAGNYFATVTAINPAGSVTATTTVNVYEQLDLPVGGGTKTTSDGVLTFEWGADLTESLTIKYTPQLTTSYSTGDFDLGGIYFHLEAADETGDPVVDLTQPLTLTLSYADESLPAGLDESDLEIWRYDPDLGDWVALPLISRDMVANTITVLLEHFSEFALMVPEGYEAYLPLTLRN
jgi:uncharacterized repeat protein (TIGR01451 family)